MTKIISRRPILIATATAFTALFAGRVSTPGRALAQSSAGGLLDRLKQAQVVKVAIANEPPYSALNPDGSVTGLAPTVVQTIMKRLGVPQVEGIIAEYGQLIPGLQAGRWDIIGAALNVTKARCEQVLYADPIVADGGTFAYIPADLGSPPNSIADAAKQDIKVGILTGSYLLQKAQQLGVAAANITQFPDNPALMDGLAAKRVQIALSTRSSLLDLRKKRNDAFDIIYPLPDDPPSAAAPAFRKGDTDLYDAFQREARALKTSGEFTKLSRQFGFDFPPDMMSVTAEEACSRAS